jgi:hypothetical protein
VIVLDMEDVVDKTSVVTMMMVVAKEDMLASCNDEQGVLRVQGTFSLSPLTMLIQRLKLHPTTTCTNNVKFGIPGPSLLCKLSLHRVAIVSISCWLSDEHSRPCGPSPLKGNLIPPAGSCG